MSAAVAGNRGSRVSPSPAKGSTAAYTDTDLTPNVLAIPLSAIQASPAEPRCGPLAGAAPSALATAIYEVDAPQPLVDRRPSLSLLKWGSTRRYEVPTPTVLRQVTFGNSSNNNCGTVAHNGVRTEPISLATLDRDCFIIPMQSLNRFLPDGIPLPAPSEANEKQSTGPLSVLEVSDPKLCILAHLMSPLEPIDPLLESPLSHPLLKQRAVAAELVSEVQQSNSAVGGMLLANMEKNAEFPFIAYYVINTTQTDPSNFYSGVRTSSLCKFEPKNLRYTAAHTLDLYSEVASICRPPLVMTSNEAGALRKAQTPSTGYIISVYKVFEGDDGERFERNWLYWTGARMLYRYLPRTAGLRRIALHKSTSLKGDKMYLLVCECADLLKDISAAAFLIPALRARLCGYTGLYRPIQAF
ncbi:uncharacterized protein LOC132256381 isoform X1 [Phlebotomus argentipes]|uniref:uncharacterized protein LOC132256381 isoform X1 n=1 Tax=Phlebotomus argentipes TaxID=94469 RepID=UPI0028933989|nr:uncharacterized protein LOC132256381 isoform X1 [Phlebotomus argentipes]